MLRNLTFTLIMFGALGMAKTALAEPLPFTKDNWAFVGGTKLEEKAGQQAVRLGVRKKPDDIVGFGMVVAKTAPFLNGTIEYDLLFDATRSFGGLRFRTQSRGNFETFYMRAHQSGNPDANQYMPEYNGVPSWELHYGKQYSSPTVYQHGKWIHVKLVVNDGLADIYIGDKTKPEYTVNLLRESKKGGLALYGLNLSGPVWVANFNATPMDKTKIIGKPVPAVVGKAGTVEKWQISDAFEGAKLAGKTRLSANDLKMKYHTMVAKKSGQVNLSILQGVAKGADTIFARLDIHSDSDQIKAFEFGFSDVGTVFLNGNILFSGMDVPYTRDYRFLGTVGLFDTVFLNLKKGKNELIIAVRESTAFQTGWAVQGRFRDTSGISLHK